MIDDKVDPRELTSILFHRWNRLGQIKQCLCPL